MFTSILLAEKKALLLQLLIVNNKDKTLKLHSMEPNIRYRWGYNALIAFVQKFYHSLRSCPLLKKFESFELSTKTMKSVWLAVIVVSFYNFT